MTARTVELAELKNRDLEDVLHEVAEQDEILMVRLADGETVTIQHSPRLKPLPVLRGSVPEGWKDAINGPGE